MLVLTRKSQQQIKIGENVTITILLIKGNTVRVGIEAPRSVRVLRAELPVNDGAVVEEVAAKKTKGGLRATTPASDQSRESVGPLAAARPSLLRRTMDVRSEPRDLRRRLPGDSSASLTMPAERLGPASLQSIFARH